ASKGFEHQGAGWTGAGIVSGRKRRGGGLYITRARWSSRRDRERQRRRAMQVYLDQRPSARINTAQIDVSSLALEEEIDHAARCETVPGDEYGGALLPHLVNRYRGRLGRQSG